MRIDFNQGPQTVSETNRNASQTVASEHSPAGAAATDQAQFSAGHAQVQALAAEAAQLPEVREERVNALRQAILSGRYESRPENTAGAMMEEMTSSPAA